MLVDSHCHLDDERLSIDRAAVVARARQAGVGRMISISTTLQEFPKVKAIAHAFDDVYCSVGVHPEYADKETEVTAEQLIAEASDAKVVGIGETGLDYFYDGASPASQEARFREHLRAARVTGLPVIVHSRDAEADTMRILNDARAQGQGGPLTGVLHCFSSRRVLAEEAVAIGFYISLSGIITFKKSQELRDIVRDVPLDKLLVETDSPYLAPEPYRGKTCEPAYVTNTAKVLAEIKGISVEEIARITTENFFRLFTKVPRP